MLRLLLLRVRRAIFSAAFLEPPEAEEKGDKDDNPKDQLIQCIAHYNS
jgi:hypothetical protein